MGIEPIPPELNSGVLSRLNYGVIQKRWASDVSERRHSMLGIEPRALEFSLKTLRPP